MNLYMDIVISGTAFVKTDDIGCDGIYKLYNLTIIFFFNFAQDLFP